MTSNGRARSIELQRLAHAYDTEPVVKGVDLTVAPGESFVLLGESGCGKTTLLRLIAGLERPAGGQIKLGDEVVVDEGEFVAPERRQVGLVFQDWAVFPHLSVERNVAYGLGRRGRGGSAVAETLELVGLDGYGDRMPATLSGGQQQRVALARALAPKPSILLLDEPFSNLDATLRAGIRAEIRDLLAGLGITSVFVTHDQNEAFFLGDRIGVMAAGELLQTATARELYDRPVSRQVADFVGLASILEGRAEGTEASTPLGRVPLLEPATGRVQLLVRPEHVAVEQRPTVDNETVGEEAVVMSVDFRGHETIVSATLDGTDLSLLARVPASQVIVRGDPVSLRYVGPGAVCFEVTPR